MAPLYSRVPVSHDSVRASQHARYQDPETEDAKRNSALISFVVCGFPTVKSQNVLCEKGL